MISQGLTDFADTRRLDAAALVRPSERVLGAGSRAARSGDACVQNGHNN